MFSETPELYDAIYQSLKDYRREAEAIAQLLARTAPSARTLLDVACGTGEHARYLQAEHGYSVHGIDLEPRFIELARAKLPGSSFWQGDMTDFELDMRFDAVLCLFSSIGYLGEPERVEEALCCFRRHVTPQGVVLVEPWFTPDSWNPGQVFVHSAAAGGLQIVRMSHSTVIGSLSKLEFHYLIGSRRGIEHRIEHHELGLFTKEQMLRCFERAGYGSVEYDAEGLTGRGLYVARLASE